MTPETLRDWFDKYACTCEYHGITNRRLDSNACPVHDMPEALAHAAAWELKEAALAAAIRENAGLYRRLEASEQARQRAEKALRALIESAKASEQGVEHDRGMAHNLYETGEWGQEILDAVAALAETKED